MLVKNRAINVPTVQEVISHDKNFDKHGLFGWGNLGVCD